jgi:hypothetical protein
MSFSKTQLQVCPAGQAGLTQIVCDNPTTATEIASQAKSDGYEPEIHDQVVVLIKRPFEEIQAFLKKQNFNLEYCKYTRAS